MWKSRYLELADWQFYFKGNWWKPYDRFDYPADEYGPAERIVCIGPLQMRFYVWGRN